MIDVARRGEASFTAHGAQRPVIRFVQKAYTEQRTIRCPNGVGDEFGYLGDALDHWKGSLFEYLQSEAVLRDLTVDPMAIDANQWIEDDFGLYAYLLRVRRDHVVRHKAPLAARTNYFAEITQDGDLFLDPDTGVATNGASPIAKYVKPSELATLLQTNSRIVAVYQHVRAQKTCTRIDGCLCAIATVAAGIQWCSYESPTVAMLFLSSNGTRICEIGEALARMLGRHVDRRVRWSKTQTR